MAKTGSSQEKAFQQDIGFKLFLVSITIRLASLYFSVSNALSEAVTLRGSQTFYL